MSLLLEQLVEQDNYLDRKAAKSLGGEVRLVGLAQLPTAYGMFRVVGFCDAEGLVEHAALIMGEVMAQSRVLVRLHSECLTGDALGSLRCDCRTQLAMAQKAIAAAGCGVLLYLRQEGRGIGLHNKLLAYQLQDRGLDTVAANEALGFAEDQRDYRLAAAFLKRLGIAHIALLTNNPHKITELGRLGLIDVTRIPLQVQANAHNQRYLQTKAQRCGHWLSPEMLIPGPNASQTAQCSD